MSDRVKGFTIVLDADVRDDDAAAVAHAIGMVKGVLDVAPLLVEPTDWMARQRARNELRARIVALLREDG